jgi:hypothetical protein
MDSDELLIFFASALDIWSVSVYNDTNGGEKVNGVINKDRYHGYFLQRGLSGQGFQT